MITNARCKCGNDIEIEFDVERGEYKPYLITEMPVRCGECGEMLGETDVYGAACDAAMENAMTSAED